jgi:hypothetical protein
MTIVGLFVELNLQILKSSKSKGSKFLKCPFISITVLAWFTWVRIAVVDSK